MFDVNNEQGIESRVIVYSFGESSNRRYKTNRSSIEQEHLKRFDACSEIQGVIELYPSWLSYREELETANEEEMCCTPGLMEYQLLNY